MNTASFNRYINEHRVAVVGVAALIVLTGLVYLVEIAPILSERDAFQKSSADLSSKRQALGNAQNLIRSAEKQIKTLTDAKASELTLEPSQQINDRLSMLSSLAAERGLILESTEPGNAIPQARYSTISIRLTGHGRFPQCVQFLQELRQQLPDVAVNDIGLHGGADGADVNFVINLHWFAAPEAAVAKTDTN